MNPILTRGVESVELLEAKLQEAIRRHLPWALPDLIEIASQFLRRSLTDARLRRLSAPPVVLEAAHRLTEHSRRRLTVAGVTDDALERIKELYPLAEDIRRQIDAEMQLEEKHG